MLFRLFWLFWLFRLFWLFWLFRLFFRACDWLREFGTLKHHFKDIDMLLLHNGQWVFNMAACFSCVSYSQHSRLTTITYSPTSYILSSQKLVYITSTQKAVCIYFMKQVLYILKACDVVHCQYVFNCYARVIMLRTSCFMLEINELRWK